MDVWTCNFNLGSLMFVDKQVITAKAEDKLLCR